MPNFGNDERAEHLRQNLARLPEAEPGSNSTEGWSSRLEEIHRLIINDDPRRFCRWDVIGSMFVHDAKYLKHELRFLRSRKDWKSRWRSVLEEDPTGSPPPCPYFRGSSGNLIHHAYHIARFEAETGVSARQFNFVFEFGGGYGSMCRLFHKLGFTGRYLIFDLPLLTLLQRYYLDSIGVPLLSEPAVASHVGTILLSDWQTLKSQVALSMIGSKSLFLATWSLSETPFSLRSDITPLLKTFNMFLIAYQREYEGMDNVRYFEEWKSSFGPDVTWKQKEISHIPGNIYLFGERNE